jgi:hypothetical protein
MVEVVVNTMQRHASFTNSVQGLPAPSNALAGLCPQA